MAWLKIQPHAGVQETAARAMRANEDGLRHRLGSRIAMAACLSTCRLPSSPTANKTREAIHMPVLAGKGRADRTTSQQQPASQRANAKPPKRFDGS